MELRGIKALPLSRSPVLIPSEAFRDMQSKLEHFIISSLSVPLPQTRHHFIPHIIVRSLHSLHDRPRCVLTSRPSTAAPVLFHRHSPFLARPDAACSGRRSRSGLIRPVPRVSTRTTRCYGSRSIGTAEAPGALQQVIHFLPRDFELQGIWSEAKYRHI